jgi:uncharacterized protein (DUF1697 family)
MAASVIIALLRAIGPRTHQVMSMRALREACVEAGLPRVRTYIQTGNVLIETRRSAASVQATLRRVLRGFDLSNSVILRRAADLDEIIAADPFPEAAATRASELAVFFLSTTPNADGLAELLRHPGPERLKIVGGDLCVDYVNGIARSKLAPAKVERLLGAPATARNWNSVTKLARLALEVGSEGAPR